MAVAAGRDPPPQMDVAKGAGLVAGRERAQRPARGEGRVEHRRRDGLGVHRVEALERDAETAELRRHRRQPVGPAFEIDQECPHATEDNPAKVACAKPLNLLYNFHWVVPGEAARSAQPYLGLFETLLRANAIASVINLRGRHPGFAWWDDEAAACARAGVAHFDAMLDSKRLPLEEMLIALFDAFDAAPKPFLVKCSGGQDRTSLAAALYIVHRDGWSALARAQRQFARWPYLHFPKPHQRWLRAFLPAAQAEAAGAPLADWVRQGYAPERFSRVLPPGTFNGIWEPWKPRSR